MWTCLLLTIAFSSLVFHPQFLFATLQDQIYPPSSSPYGLPLKEWGIKHWEWWNSIPKEISPYPNPKQWTYHCFMGLGYPVVMLVNPIVGETAKNVAYDCTIPADRGILVSGITELCSYDETHKTDEDLQKCVKARNDWAKHQITIDGKTVDNIGQYRFTTDFFNVTWPEDNMWTLPVGTYRALLDGTWLMLKPLPIGDHKIEVHIVQIIPGRESENLFINLVYNLHVV
jgi:hypothetical protein